MHEAKKTLNELTAVTNQSPDIDLIATLLIVELADVNSELPSLGAKGDNDAYFRVIQLAKTRTELLSATDAKYLADWIFPRVDRASVRGRVSSNAKLISLYDEYLAKRTTVDTERLSIESAKARSERSLKALLPPESDFPIPNVGAFTATGWNARTISASAGRGSTLDCLRLIDPSKDAIKGPWSRGADGTINVAMIDMHREGPLIRVPVQVNGSYDFHGRFKRTAGRDAIMFGLPAEKGHFLVGLGGPDGIVVVRNSVKRRIDLVNGRDNEISVQVRIQNDLARIVVVLNGEEIHNDRWPLSALDAGPVWVLAEENVPSISVVDSAYTINSYTITPVGGSVGPLRKQ